MQLCFICFLRYLSCYSCCLVGAAINTGCSPTKNSGAVDNNDVGSSGIQLLSFFFYKKLQKFGLICFIIILLNTSEDVIFTVSQNSNIHVALTFFVSILT